MILINKIPTKKTNLCSSSMKIKILTLSSMFCVLNLYKFDIDELTTLN